MRTELMIERTMTKQAILIGIGEFMKETDKEKALEILNSIKRLSRRVEEINCKLAHDELRKILNK